MIDATATEKTEKVARCAPIATQHATNDNLSATFKRNTNATNSLKALAGAVLQRNTIRNDSATGTLKTAQQIDEKNTHFVAQNCAVVAGENDTEIETQNLSKPYFQITTIDRQALTNLLAHIGETDTELLDEFWQQVEGDTEALAYFLTLQSQEIPPKPMPQVRCADCANFQPYYTHGKGAGKCLADVQPMGVCHSSDATKECEKFKPTDSNSNP